MFKKISVMLVALSEKSEHVSSFYRALNACFKPDYSRNLGFTLKDDLSQALNGFLRARIPEKKSAKESDALFQRTFQKLYLYEDKLSKELRPLVRATLDSYFVEALLPHFSGSGYSETVMLTRFSNLVQSRFGANESLSHVWSSLNRAVLLHQGDERIAAMHTAMDDSPGIKAGLTLGFRVLYGLQQDPEGPTPSQLQAAFAGSFLHGASTETVRALLTLFPVVFVNKEIDTSVLGRNPKATLQQAYLDLMTGDVSPDQVDLLRTCVLSAPSLQELDNFEVSIRPKFGSPEKPFGSLSSYTPLYPPILNLLAYAEDAAKRVKKGALEIPGPGSRSLLLMTFRENILNAMDSRIHNEQSLGFVFDEKPLVELVTYLAICPDYRPKEGDLLWFTALSPQNRALLSSNVPGFLSELPHLKSRLEAIFTKSIPPVSTFHVPMSASWDEDGLDRHEPMCSFGPLPMASRYQSGVSHASIEALVSSAIGTWKEDIMASPHKALSNLPLTIFIDEFSVRIPDIDASWKCFEDGLTAFFMSIMDPSVFQTERTPERILSDLLPFVTNHDDPSMVFQCIIGVANEFNLTLENTSKFNQAMRHVFGHMPAYTSCDYLFLGQIGCDISDVFTSFNRKVRDSFAFPTQIEEELITDFFNDVAHIRKSAEILGRDRLPVTLRDAYTGYAALYVLAAHPAAQQDSGIQDRGFFGVCDAWNLENQSVINDRLASMGARVSELILKETHGLTTVEKAALQKLKHHYQTTKLLALTPKGEFAASLNLNTAEEKAMQGLFSQKKNSASNVEKFFFFAGLHDYMSQDISVFQKTTGGKTVVSRVLEEDVVTVRNIHLGIYLDALRKILDDAPNLTSLDKRRVQEEMRHVARDMAHPLVMQDTSSDVKSAKKSLKAALGKKGNIAFTRQRFSDFLETLDSKKELAINPKSYLQDIAEETINTKREWIQKRHPVGELTSVITPANGSVSVFPLRNKVMESRGRTGMGCQSNLACTTAAANNQLTELFSQDGPKGLFSGVRHGIVATLADPAKTVVCLGDVAASASPDLVMVEQNSLDGLASRTVDTLSIEEIHGYVGRNSHIMSAESALTLRALAPKDLGKAQVLLAKHVANYNKAKDLLRSAMLQKINALQRAGKPLVDDSNRIHVEVVSISLVTPDDFRPVLAADSYHEKQMLAEQTEALACLKGMPSLEKSAFLAEYLRADGTPIFSENVSLSVGVNTFNFGVNEGEFAGRTNQRAMNVAAMDTFNRYLCYLNTSHVDVSVGLIEDDEIYTKTLEVSFRDAFLKQLLSKVETSFQAYQRLTTLSMSKQSNPYEMPVLLAVLAHLVDAEVLFNCKSGKDRTSLMDVMVKIFMRQLYAAIPEDSSSVDRRGAKTSGGAIDFVPVLNYFRRLDAAYDAQLSAQKPVYDTYWLKDEQKANREMLFNSGNREVQEENTTAWGYKLEGDNTARMFAVVFGIENMGEVYGFSKLIEA